MSWWAILKQAAANWLEHKDARQGAALAYYSVFSFGPLTVIAIAIAGLVFGPDAVRGEVASQLKSLLGNGAAQAIEAMLAGASQPREGIPATVLGIGTLLFAAVGVVVQLKDALNTVWEVGPGQRRDLGIPSHLHRVAGRRHGGRLPSPGVAVGYGHPFCSRQISCSVFA